MRGRNGALLLLVLAAAPLAGQSRLSLGVELGYTIADFSGPGAAGVRQRTGATAGAYLRVPLARWIGVQSGLFLASKGGATLVTPTGGGTPVRLESDLAYVELPMLLRARLPSPGGLRLILTGGVVPGVRIGCNVEFFQDGASFLRESCGNISTARFEDYDVAWLVGGGLGIPIERSELALEVRLSQGLRRVTDQGDFQNRNVTFFVSVPF
ncbi:MAG: PorT family protein [Gemmatimonadetes bacterium]|nr:PorT family protein [Gemmatimonadota bacterium]